MSGPFADPSSSDSPKAKRGRAPRDWERDALPMNWGQNAPAEVGKMGRRKDRARMEKRARAAEDGDDDDWFNRQRDMNRPKRSKDVKDTERERRGGGSGTKIAFSASLKDRLSTSSGTPSGSKPGLAERLGMAKDDGRDRFKRDDGRLSRRDRRDRDQDRYRGRDRDVDGYRDRDKDRDRDRSRGGERHGTGNGRDRHNGRDGDRRRYDNTSDSREMDRRREHSRADGQDMGPRYKGGYAAAR
jgi:protein AIR1/2